MPKKAPTDEKNSITGGENLLDFLYFDRERVDLFLSQFDQSGSLQSIVKRDESIKNQSRGYSASVNVGGSIAGTGGSGGLNVSRDPKNDGTENTELTYNPLWKNAFTLIKTLEKNNLIDGDTKTKRLGSFCIFSGKLSIVDLSLAQKIMKTDFIRKKFEGTKNKYKSQKNFTALNILDTSMSVVDSFPLSIHGRVRGKNYAWFNLRPESLIIPPDSLLLKYGENLDGEWHVLGILDAEPRTASEWKESLEAARNNPDYATGELLGKIYSSFSPILHVIAGRPDGYYGITPLLIYRNIS